MSDVKIGQNCPEEEATLSPTKSQLKKIPSYLLLLTPRAAIPLGA